MALWQGRLARAQLARDNYLQAARYPHESRPMDEHPDQVHPFEPIAEDRPLRMPGGSVTQGVRLKTTQERVFASGNESATASRWRCRTTPAARCRCASRARCSAR